MYWAARRAARVPAHAAQPHRTVHPFYFLIQGTSFILGFGGASSKRCGTSYPCSPDPTHSSIQSAWDCILGHDAAANYPPLRPIGQSAKSLACQSVREGRGVYGGRHEAVRGKAGGRPAGQAPRRPHRAVPAASACDAAFLRLQRVRSDHQLLIIWCVGASAPSDPANPD